MMKCLLNRPYPIHSLSVQKCPINIIFSVYGFSEQLPLQKGQGFDGFITHRISLIVRGDPRFKGHPGDIVYVHKLDITGWRDKEIAYTGKIGDMMGHLDQIFHAIDEVRRISLDHLDQTQGCLVIEPGELSAG